MYEFLLWSPLNLEFAGCISLLMKCSKSADYIIRLKNIYDMTLKNNPWTFSSPRFTVAVNGWSIGPLLPNR